MSRFALAISLVAAAILGVACSSQRPALYPNDHLKQVSEAQAQADVDECIAIVKQHGIYERDRKEQVRSVGRTTAVGAGTGAAVGALRGKPGRGAATGAVAGAASGTMRQILRSNKPDSVFKGYVDRCLADRGYDVVGWR